MPVILNKALRVKMMHSIILETSLLPFLGDCVVIGETVGNVMPNLFRHLTESNSYETLNQVQGNKIVPQLSEKFL